ncbi:MAG: NAD-dependent epimerase/dehydratase family protein [Bacteroidales bacterium]|nr:NAD-dependent epimerase/dehydratase family protein [Lentimicrobiaceae bacterium]MDD5695617.1 NAD-dependent epimerase/dehydratase family protein [Bacteroidales bacterium]
MRIAITGASGHVGSTLVRELNHGKHQLKLLIHQDQKGLDGLEYIPVKGNVFDIGSLDELCRDVDVVFHLAAIIAIDKKNRDLVYKTNVEGTRNVVDICLTNKVPRLIHFSSIHALNPFPLEEPLDESRSLVTNSHGLYDQSKADGERIVKEKVQKEGLNALILNPTAIIGPNDYRASYLGQALRYIYEGSLPTLVPGGYDWVDVRDVARAAINAIKMGTRGENYLLSGTYMPLKELSMLIQEITPHKTPKGVVPTRIARLGLPFIQFYAWLKNEAPLYTADSLRILKECNPNIKNDKARKELGFSPRPLKETLIDTFAWQKSAWNLK